MKVKHLKSALREVERGIALEKACAIEAQAEATKIAEEVKMVIEGMRYGAIEEIT